jgi:hypothetical protein
MLASREAQFTGQTNFIFKPLAGQGLQNLDAFTLGI